jgi:hypothetical protein
MFSSLSEWLIRRGLPPWVLGLRVPCLSFDDSKPERLAPCLGLVEGLGRVCVPGSRELDEAVLLRNGIVVARATRNAPAPFSREPWHIVQPLYPAAHRLGGPALLLPTPSFGRAACEEGHRSGP